MLALGDAVDHGVDQLQQQRVAAIRERAGRSLPARQLDVGVPAERAWLLTPRPARLPGRAAAHPRSQRGQVVVRLVSGRRHEPAREELVHLGVGVAREEDLRIADHVVAEDAAGRLGIPLAQRDLAGHVGVAEPDHRVEEDHRVVGVVALEAQRSGRATPELEQGDLILDGERVVDRAEEPAVAFDRRERREVGVLGGLPEPLPDVRPRLPLPRQAPDHEARGVWQQAEHLDRIVVAGEVHGVEPGHARQRLAPALAQLEQDALECEQRRRGVHVAVCAAHDRQQAVRLRAHGERRQRRPAAHELGEELADRRVRFAAHDRRALLGREQVAQVTAPRDRPQDAVHRRHGGILVRDRARKPPQQRVVGEAEGARQLARTRRDRSGQAHVIQLALEQRRDVGDVGGPAGHSLVGVVGRRALFDHVEAVAVVMRLEQREQRGLVALRVAHTRDDEREPARADIDVGDVGRDRHARVERPLVVDHPGHLLVDGEGVAAVVVRHQVLDAGRAVQRPIDLLAPGDESALVSKEPERTPAVWHQRRRGGRHRGAGVELGEDPALSLDERRPRLSGDPHRPPRRELAYEVVAGGVRLAAVAALPVGGAERHLALREERGVVVDVELARIDADLQVVAGEARLDPDRQQQERSLIQLEALGMVELAQQHEVALELVRAERERSG